MKKIMTALLAFALSAFMAVPALASNSTGDVGTGSITISNPKDDATYMAYKIFDVTYDTDAGAYSYTIDSSSPWFETVVANYDIEQVNGTSTYTILKQKDGKTAASIAKALKDAYEGMTSKPSGIAMPGGTVTGLELGYYFISGTSGAVCSLTTTKPNATVVDKNEQPPFEKEVSDQDVEIGQTVTYTITGKVPTTDGYSAYQYIVSDKLSSGLTLNRDVTVKFGNDVISEVIPAYADNGFTLTYDMTQFQQYAGQEITITYTALVNENAVIGAAGNKNDAKLEYSNDPTDSTKTNIITTDETVYTCKIVVHKFEKGNNSVKLADAEFLLYKLDNGTKMYYKFDGKKVQWSADISEATTMTTDTDGIAEFPGLEAGTYYLTETGAPDGYNKLTADVTVTITRTTDAGGATVITGNEPQVENSKGIELPITGDMGTKVLYAVGGIMVLCAAVALIARKRASVQEKDALK